MWFRVGVWGVWWQSSDQIIIRLSLQCSFPKAAVPAMRSIFEVAITLPGASAAPSEWETLVVQLIDLWLYSA